MFFFMYFLHTRSAKRPKTDEPATTSLPAKKFTNLNIVTGIATTTDVADAKCHCHTENPKIFVYGWNWEVDRAYRSEFGTVSQELAVPLDEQKPPADRCGEAYVARWPDGTEHAIEAMTNKDARLRLAASTSGSAAGQKGQVIWENIQATTGHRLEIRQKADAVMMLVLYNQAKKVFTINLPSFSKQPLPKNADGMPATLPANHEAIVNCMKMLAPLLHDYARGEINDEEAKQRKNEELKAWRKANVELSFAAGTKPNAEAEAVAAGTKPNAEAKAVEIEVESEVPNPSNHAPSSVVLQESRSD